MLTDWVEEEARAARSRRQAWDLINGQAAFDPRQVPEVAAGYFWDPTAASGSAVAGFLLPEGNQQATHDLITPVAGTAPTIGSLNSQAIITYANGSPDRIARTGAVDRGFTGAACFGGWINQAAAAGNLISHGRGATPVFYIQFVAGSVRVGINDGVSIKETLFPLPPGGYAAGPFFYLAGFDPTEGVATARTKLWIDDVAQVPSVTASPGTSMSDPTDVIAMGAGSSTDSGTSNISADWSHGMIYLTNGIPSAGDRARLFAHKRLK